MSASVRDRVGPLALSQPSLQLLILYGSRARGDAHPGSDWDFGYLAGPDFDPGHLLGSLVRTLECDAIDLVDLARASGHLRYRAAADAVVVHGATSVFNQFWFDAVSYWCDMQGVIRAEYARALAELPR